MNIRFWRKLTLSATKRLSRLAAFRFDLQKAWNPVENDTIIHKRGWCASQGYFGDRYSHGQLGVSE